MEKQLFFISRAGSDSQFAQWLSRELKADGHETILQDKDFGPQNFIAAMDNAFKTEARIIALYSRAYLESPHCLNEAQHWLGPDPANTQKKLVPFRIETCSPTGILQNVAYKCLVSIRDAKDQSSLKETIWRALGLLETNETFDPFRSVSTQIVHPEVYSDPRFAGREDLLVKLHSALNEHGAAAVKALKGTGGVGKTTVAREYAARHRNDYEGVWWVRAESDATMQDDLIDLGAKYIPGLKEAGNRDEARQLALQSLENLSASRPWLIVYDNAPKQSALKGKVPRAGAKVIITSRDPRWEGVAAPIDVDVFTPQAATQFLLERTGRDDVEGAEELAERLGYLPLALEQAAGYLNEASDMPFVGPESYLFYLNDMIRKAPDSETYADSVYGAVSLSLEKAAKQNPEAIAFFGLLALMDPDRIPLGLFEDAPPFNGLELTEVVNALSRVSLVKRTPLEDGRPAISVHRLSQDVIRAKLHEDGALEAANGAALALLRAAWPGDAGDVRNWPAIDDMLPHVVAATDHTPDNTTDHEALVSLLGKLDILFDARAQYSGAEEASRRALKVAETHFDANAPEIAIRLNNLAQLLETTNRLDEAEPMYRRVIEIFELQEQQTGHMHPNYAGALNNLAALLQATNRFDEAEPLMRRALAIDEASYGPDHPSVAIRLNNLAGLLRATNRLVEAEPLYRRVIEIFELQEQQTGHMNPNYAGALNNLAVLLEATNRLDEAEPLMRRALSIDEASYGPDHPEVAMDLNNLAGTYAKTGRLAEALPMIQRADEIFSASLPDHHPHVQSTKQARAMYEMMAAAGMSGMADLQAAMAQAKADGALENEGNAVESQPSQAEEPSAPRKKGLLSLLFGRKE
ncbi:MAG: tetratricopeptide repeat protein [Pseudomonadota bacterium]